MHHERNHQSHGRAPEHPQISADDARQGRLGADCGSRAVRGQRHGQAVRYHRGGDEQGTARRAGENECGNHGQAGFRPLLRRTGDSDCAGGQILPHRHLRWQPRHGQPDAGGAFAGAGQHLDSPREGRIRAARISGAAEKAGYRGRMGRHRALRSRLHRRRSPESGETQGQPRVLGRVITHNKKHPGE